MKNKVNLITYVDRMSGGGVQDLNRLITGPLKDVFGGAHLLPFFYPIDGADAGFDPIDHTIVDPQIGDWSDVKELSQSVELTADLIVNHVSADSEMFQDYLRKGDKSEYAELFLTEDKIFPEGITDAEMAAIYRPRPGSPFTPYEVAGETKHLWTTFTAKQIDIDVFSDAGQRYLESILQAFAENGIKLIRLDAAGYAVKKPGTSCFMLPETFDFIHTLTQRAHELGMEVLVEIHSYYKEQIAIAQKVDYVYDFALPPLILHAIYTQTGEYLNKWLQISPRNAITVLDTHDGIGVIDVGPHAKDKSKKGLIPDAEVDRLVEEMHERTGGQSRQATGAAASNLDLYQVNSTYYDTLGREDDLYILARAIQFFAPGIPQVYYIGMLAEVNDMDLLAKSNVGRDINRHYFSHDEAVAAVDRPVVQRLISLIQYRNQAESFDGEFSSVVSGQTLELAWTKGDQEEKLIVDFDSLDYTIYSKQNEETVIERRF